MISLRKLSISSFMLISTTFAFVLSSCKGDGTAVLQESPAQVVESFGKATIEGDYARAVSLTDTPQEERPTLEAWLKMMFGQLDGGRFEALSEERSDDGRNACVKAVLSNSKTSDTIYINTVKVDDVWLVSLTL